MAKYSFEFKMKVVQEYLEGKGSYTYLTNKYAFKSSAQIRHWINSYHEFGEEGLRRSRKNIKYSVQFKLDAIELYQTNEYSYRELANCLGMMNPSLIANWMRQFRENGIEGLSKPKGRPPKMAKKKKSLAPVATPLTDQERIKELEKQVRALEIKNAFLKELRKLRKQEAQERRTKQSQESFTASEDDSN